MKPAFLNKETILGKVIRLPLKVVPERVHVPIFRGKLRGAKWIVSSSNNSSCWLGHYEEDQRTSIENLVNEDSVVFDIGAHVGFYTLLFSRLVGPGGKVIAFEPLPRNLHFLREHLRINKLENVQIIELALFDSEGEASFAADNFVDARITEAGQMKVKTATLDELMNKAAIPAPDFLKMDIEGAEAKALAGARKTLKKHHPVLFLTTHGPEIHQQCLDLLAEIGYTFTILEKENPEGVSRQIIARHENGSRD